MRRKLLSVLLIILVSIGSVSCSLIAANQPISPMALQEKIEAQSAPTILDVRSDSEYEAGHVPGAINIEYRQLPQRLNELPVAKGQPIVVYCETGVRAAIASTTLTTAGYKPILQLTGHMKAWRAEGLPVEVIN
ncbi:MAG: rhodanese-like domain-containing protein [Thermosynechococcaceae cyanobacterium]